MKKKSYKIYIVLFSIALVYYILKFSGALVLSTISSSSSEPTIKKGSYILTTSLKTPKRGDLITFTFNDRLSHDLPYQDFNYIFRLCGVENDTIEIKKGVLYVNGENFDKQFELKHSYLLSQAQLGKLNDSYSDKIKLNKDTFMVFMKDSDANLNALGKYKYIEKKNHVDDLVKENYQQNWNKDYFGPLLIPEGKIFVLGNNRDNARDSRYIGLIDATAITGVYWKTLF
ncbi:signal peptidase I [Kordia sp.]|uniref:signal peptidase I n=1 Tax=Kordia sp. TaxID=1965332 RepID=UPI003D2BBCCB